MRKLYDWMMRQASGPHAERALAIISFVESSFFPIPPDVMLVPMCLARREQAFRYALICTIASVIGGLAGYAIGYFLFETLGDWIIRVYGYGERMHSLQETYREWGVWIILVKGLTPIPYKLVTIASGLAQMDIVAFIAASIVTRGMRFYAEAALLWKFGEPIREFIERRLNQLTWIFFIVLIGGFVVVKFIV